MSHHHDDPIEGLREAFQSLMPSTTQQAKWLVQVRATQASQTQRHLASESLHREPVPWKLLLGSGIAALLTLAAWLASPVSPLGGGDPWTGTRANVDRAMSMAEQPLAEPSTSGMMWHVPATGLDLRMIDSITDLMAAPFSSDQGPAGT